MQNGYRMPDEMTMLVNISRSLGRVEGKLEYTDRRMDKQDRILLETAKRVRRLEGQTKTEKKPSSFRQWSDVLRLLWPFLMLIVAVVSRVGSGNIDWLIAFLEHVKIQ